MDELIYLFCVLFISSTHLMWKRVREAHESEADVLTWRTIRLRHRLRENR